MIIRIKSIESLSNTPKIEEYRPKQYREVNTTTGWIGDDSCGRVVIVGGLQVTRSGSCYTYQQDSSIGYPQPTMVEEIIN